MVETEGCAEALEIFLVTRLREADCQEIVGSCGCTCSCRNTGSRHHSEYEVNIEKAVLYGHVDVVDNLTAVYGCCVMGARGLDVNGIAARYVEAIAGGMIEFRKWLKL